MDQNIDNTVKESIGMLVTDPTLAKITEKQLKQYSDTTTVESIQHKAKTGLNQSICDRHADTEHLDKDSDAPIVHQTNTDLPVYGTELTLQHKWKTLKIKLMRVNLDKDASMLVTQNFLDNLPSKKYPERTVMTLSLMIAMKQYCIIHWKRTCLKYQRRYY